MTRRARLLTVGLLAAAMLILCGMTLQTMIDGTVGGAPPVFNWIQVVGLAGAGLGGVLVLVFSTREARADEKVEADDAADDGKVGQSR